MLSDLTLDICVPSLRWMDAHRMHRKMPNYHGLAFWDVQSGWEAGRKRVGRVIVVFEVLPRGGDRTYAP